MAFDTLKYSESLKEAGVDEKQAAAHAHALRNAIEDDLASKSDLKQEVGLLRSDMEKMGTELRSDMEKMGTELRSDMEKMETRLMGEIGKLDAVMKIILGLCAAIAVGMFSMVIKVLFFS